MWSRVVNQETDEDQERANDAAEAARLEERARLFHNLKFVFCGFVITGVGSIIFLTWKFYSVVYMLGIPAIVFLVLTVLGIIDLIQLYDQAIPGYHPTVIHNYVRPPPQYSRLSPDQLSPTSLLSMQVPFTQDEISASVPSIPVDQPPPYSEVSDRSCNSTEANKSIYFISISTSRDLLNDHTDATIEGTRDQIHDPESGSNEDLIVSQHDPPSYEEALSAEVD
ncbi:unnamed protein product [Meganyctiphanes norvegica]|uniref:Uncharacterized protein n=1 Tax=Meganyctiphanes norvegica TaxID=48144 RepID=A0AAV2QXK6_MEGNR